MRRRPTNPAVLRYMQSLRRRQRNDGRTSSSFPGSWEGRPTADYVRAFERLNHLVPTA
jgi:hypothetical protein